LYRQAFTSSAFKRGPDEEGIETPETPGRYQGSTLFKRGPDEEGIETVSLTCWQTSRRSNADLMKKGLRPSAGYCSSAWSVQTRT